MGAHRAACDKKPYRPPRLTVYGDVRDLTLGPSPGIGESGAPALFRAGFGPSLPPPGRS